MAKLSDKHRWDIWCLQSKRPDVAIRLMRLEKNLPPGLAELDGCLQSPIWHPEGDALEHTAWVCKAMADICERDKIEGERRTILMLSSLCHDMGKPLVTRWDTEKERWTSRGHAEAGVPIAQAFIEWAISTGHFDESFREKLPQILTLVREHMLHSNKDLGRKGMARAVRRLRDGGTNPQDLCLVMEADISGRPPLEPVFPHWMTELWNCH